MRFKNALVNWEIKPITYVPQTGDIVSINTFKNKYTANKHRMEFLHTPTAKAKLLKFLRSQDEELLIQEEHEHHEHAEKTIKPTIVSKHPKKISSPVALTHAVIIDEDKQLIYALCSECKPVYPSKIIAKSGKDGILIHTMSCKALRTVSFSYLLEAHWKEENPTIYTGIFTCTIPNTQKDLLSIIGVFS